MNLIRAIFVSAFSILFLIAPNTHACKRSLFSANADATRKAMDMAMADLSQNILELELVGTYLVDKTTVVEYKDRAGKCKARGYEIASYGAGDCKIELQPASGAFHCRKI